MQRRGLGVTLAVDGASHDAFGAVAFLDTGVDGAAQHVAHRAQSMAAAVPGVDRFAGHIAERPAFPDIHAHGVGGPAGYGVLGAGHHATERIDDFEHLALDIEDVAKSEEGVGRGGVGRAGEPVV